MTNQERIAALEAENERLKEKNLRQYFDLGAVTEECLSLREQLNQHKQFCSDERPCTNCFADKGECEESPTKQLAAAKEENERLKVELEQAYSTVDANWITHKQLAASQARIKELREALLNDYGEEVANHYVPVTTDNDEALRKYVAGEMRKMVEAQGVGFVGGTHLNIYAGRYEKGMV